MSAPPSEFKLYRKKGFTLARPYVPGEDVSSVSISETDREAGSPVEGDMIAVKPNDPSDSWLVSARFFDDYYEPV